MKANRLIAILLTCLCVCGGVYPGAEMHGRLMAAAEATEKSPVTEGETETTLVNVDEATLPYDESAYRNISWEATLEEITEMESGKARTKTVTVQKGLFLYDLEMKKLVYTFEDDQLHTRIFTSKKNNKDAFSYLFFSLFRRYGIPITALDKQAVWATQFVTITLLRNSEALTIKYEILR